MMTNEINVKLYSFTLDCIDPQKLANFYAALLKWEALRIDDDWACVYAPGTGQGGYPGIVFQRNPDYTPPVWPQQPGAQQQMAHLDFIVGDLEQSVRHAVACGAAEANKQFSDGWRVMLDPEGHPFCLCLMKHVLESPDCALR